MKKSNLVLPQNASEFAKSTVIYKNTAFAAANAYGRELAVQTDTLATPQEQCVADFALLATGAKKLPAHIAGIAGRGANEQKVVDFCNQYAGWLDSVNGSTLEFEPTRIRILKQNMARGANTWAAGQTHLDGYKLKSPKGAGKTLYTFEKVAVEDSTPVDTVTDPAAENAAKVAGNTKSELSAAKQKGIAAGIATGAQEASETVARQAAEIKALQELLTAAVVAEHHALCLAKSYGLGLPANPAQRGKLTKAITASKVRATAAMATSGQTIKLATVATAKQIKAALAS
jgi:hypothetical protein